MPRLLTLALTLAAIAGCRPIQLAGDSVGHYRVEATLEESTCGEGHAAPATLAFDVELRREAGSTQGYWKLAEGQLMSGELDGDAFRFEHRAQVVGIPEDAVNGVPGCMLERVEIVTGTLGPMAEDGGTADAGVGGDGFTGRTTVGITPVIGGNCAPLLLAYGGAFPVLPCQLRYSLEADAVSVPMP